MKTLLSLVMLFTTATAFAELKGPNSVTPIVCGQNEAIKAGAAKVVSVCIVHLTVVMPGGPSSSILAAREGLSVTVYEKAETQQYFYEQFVPTGLHIEPGHTASGTSMLKHYKLAGLIAGGKLVRSPLIALPSDSTVVYTLTSGSKMSLSAKFLGLDFSTSQLRPVLTTM
jgi:hypothetical protein